jgi:phage shock protein PspC (stress-responsive transcriptional regulator)
MPEIKRLYRSRKNKVIGGVCGGIAEYLEVDPVLIRLIWVIGALIWGAGFFAYLIAWIIMPQKPRNSS